MFEVSLPVEQFSVFLRKFVSAIASFNISYAIADEGLPRLHESVKLFNYFRTVSMFHSMFTYRVCKERVF